MVDYSILRSLYLSLTHEFLRKKVVKNKTPENRLFLSVVVKVHERRGRRDTGPRLILRVYFFHSRKT